MLFADWGLHVETRGSVENVPVRARVAPALHGSADEQLSRLVSTAFVPAHPFLASAEWKCPGLRGLVAADNGCVMVMVAFFFNICHLMSKMALE